MAATPPIKIPENIKLPDGRSVSVQELMKFKHDYEYVNLRNGRVKRKLAFGQRAKYTTEEYIWIESHTNEEVMERFPWINLVYANVIRHKARGVVKELKRLGQLSD
jgi:hypothetical protein